MIFGILKLFGICNFEFVIYHKSMSWLTLAIIAYLLLALVNVLDKALMSNFIKDSRVYTFTVSLLGLAAVVLAPLGLEGMAWLLWGLAIFSGVWTFLGLHWFFRALSIGEASRVITITGAGVPAFTVILAVIILGNSFNQYQWLAFLLLIIGAVILSRLPEEHHWWRDFINRFRHPRKYHYVILSVGSAFAFALSFVLSKYVYDRSNFVTGFIWGRVGTFAAALALLTHAEVRRNIQHTLSHFLSAKGALFFGNQFLGAIAIVLQSYATSLGNVAMVQSLQGVQFAAVFLIAVVASMFMPKFLKEFTRPRVLLEKAFAILLVSAGVAMLALL